MGEKNTIIFGRKEETVFHFWSKRGRGQKKEGHFWAKGVPPRSFAVLQIRRIFSHTQK
jgi:hypothetical protein